MALEERVAAKVRHAHEAALADLSGHGPGDSGGLPVASLPGAPQGSILVSTVRLMLCVDADHDGCQRPTLAEHDHALDRLVSRGVIAVQRIDQIGRVARHRESPREAPR